MTKLKDCVVIFDGQSGIRSKMVIQTLECPEVEASVSCGSKVIGRSLVSLASADASVLNSPEAHSLHFCVEVGLFNALRARGVEPLAASGYSLGEYAAIVAAGVMDLEQAVRVVEGRSRIIARVTQQLDGVTANVRGPDGLIQTVARLLIDKVSIAAVNSRQSLNITGPRDAVFEVVGRLREVHLRVNVLPFPAISHSPLLAPQIHFLKSLLARAKINVEDPIMPVINATTGTFVRRFGGAFRNLLQHQLVSKVEWTKVIARMRTLEVLNIVNVGINPYLWHETRAEWPEAQLLQVCDPQSLEVALAALS